MSEAQIYERATDIYERAHIAAYEITLHPHLPALPLAYTCVPAAAPIAWHSAPSSRRASSAPVGVVTMMSNVPAFLRIELGGIWYSPVVQRTPANLESTYLMLAHCFDQGYRRVEWKCDSRNERSRRAALRMGFSFEGIQEYHMIVKGQNRDTAWFRMLDHEWPAVRARLETMLYGSC